MASSTSLIDIGMPLSVLIAQRPETIAVFLRYKMLCVGCVIGPFHTIVNACAKHWVEQTDFVQALERAISGGPAPN